MSSLSKGTIRIKVRQDTASNWTSQNPTLGSGEFGFETDTGLCKLGDGSTAWTSLTYIGSFTLVDGDGTSVNVNQNKVLTLTHGTGIDINHTDTTGNTLATTIACNLEGTELRSSGETGGSKFLREDGDGSCSWQTASGGGGTSRWFKTMSGYKSNNNSASNYYFAYYANENLWSNYDGSIGTITYTDFWGAEIVAPADGTLTNITVALRSLDTGATDPLKFYVFKATISDEDTTASTTQIGVTGTITPALSKINKISTDISSSNTFSAGDYLFVMYKKDSTSGNQDIYFSVTVSGEYS